MKEKEMNIQQLQKKIAEQVNEKHLTLGELIQLAVREKVSLSQLVLAEACIKENKSPEEIFQGAMAQFKHNLEALDLGLKSGESFLLGRVGSELLSAGENALVGDRFLNRAIVYTLATEVANHVVGLQPCAGTGDSCPYTGLIRALQEEGYSEEQVALAAVLILKVGSIFRAGKKTTGCNMEGYGAGAAASAAVLADLRGADAVQVGKAIVLAMSPTIAVPCTPRVMVSGLCATHIGGAILMGNYAANLVLHSNLPVDVDVDVMIAMAAKVHVDAAPAITRINHSYLMPYFKKNSHVEKYIETEIREKEEKEVEAVLKSAREEIRALVASCRPITRTFGDVVVGGSSIAVGSPTNMARICHFMSKGKISEIIIELTSDLFVRRAINIPAILMAAIRGSQTDDIEMYKSIMELPETRDIEIKILHVPEPQVQRIRIKAAEQSAYLDSLNRGGGRVGIVNAEPSIEEARAVAKKLGIQIAES